jgi:hypothetical protein
MVEIEIHEPRGRRGADETLGPLEIDRVVCTRIEWVELGFRRRACVYFSPVCDMRARANLRTLLLLLIVAPIVARPCAPSHPAR